MQIPERELSEAETIVAELLRRPLPPQVQRETDVVRAQLQDLADSGVWKNDAMARKRVWNRIDALQRHVPVMQD